MRSSSMLLAISAAALAIHTTDVAAHDLAAMPVNQVLGVPGFPDCERAHPELQLNVEDAAQDLICHQKVLTKAALRLGWLIRQTITGQEQKTNRNSTQLSHACPVIVPPTWLWRAG